MIYDVSYQNRNKTNYLNFLPNIYGLNLYIPKILRSHSNQSFHISSNTLRNN